MKAFGRKSIACLALMISLNILTAQEIAIGHYKTTRYDLNIEIDYSEKLVIGNCLITIENISNEDIDTIPLLLYRHFEVLSVKDTLDNRLPLSQEVVPFIDWPENRVNYLKVMLPEPLKPKQDYALVMDYAGPLLGNTEAARYVHDHISETFTIIRDDCYAYPRLGVPVDREMMAIGYEPSFNYTLKVKVPKGLTVANIGQLDSLVHTENHSIFTYSNIKPAWRMDICIADYSLIEDRDLRMRVYYLPGDSLGAAVISDRGVKAIRFYTQKYGRISEPDHFTLIEVPSEYGSQADVNGALLQAKNFEEGADLRGLYHELSHQWDPPELGGLHIRWNEGLAEFHQYYLLHELDKKADALIDGFESARYWFKQTIRDNPEYKDYIFSEYGLRDASRLSYLKGMMFITVLFYHVGEDPFFNMMRSYYQNYFVQGATLDDFVGHVKLNAGPGVEPLIEEWLYSTRSNDYILEDLPLEEIVALYK